MPFRYNQSFIMDQAKGMLLPEEINPFSKRKKERSTIRAQFCGKIELLNNLHFICKNNHNTNNPIRFESPIGIPNLGNSCYLSAALQCLLNMKLLRLQTSQKNFKPECLSSICC